MKVQIDTTGKETFDEYIETITAIAANTNMKFTYGVIIFDGQRD